MMSMIEQQGQEGDYKNKLSEKKRFTSIQILRGMAVLTVVIFHVSEMLSQYTDRHGIFCSFVSIWQTGAAGVDLFFIISGFVMVQSTQGKFLKNGSSREFILKRLIRIVPLYWLCTSVMLSGEFWLRTLKSQVFSGQYVIKSYLFIPALSPVSGLALPLLPPGWTLSYEMYFYAFFALLLRFHPRFLLPTISTVFFLLAMIGLRITSPDPILKVITSPLLLEFVLGCYLASLVNKKHISSQTCYLMIVGSLTALINVKYLSSDIDLRLVTWGLPAFFLTAGFVFLEKNGSRFLQERRFLTVLGDSSYSTYLTHTFVVLGISALLKRKIILHTMHNDLIVISSVIACLIVGYVSYIYFEKIFSRVLLRTCLGKKQVNKPSITH